MAAALRSRRAEFASGEGSARSANVSGSACGRRIGTGVNESDEAEHGLEPDPGEHGPRFKQRDREVVSVGLLVRQRRDSQEVMTAPLLGQGFHPV